MLEPDTKVQTTASHNSPEVIINNARQFAMQCEDVDYIISIDGGGSKTSLQVINSKMEVLDLEYDGVTTKSLIAGPGNINIVGFPEVKNSLESLLARVKIGPEKLELKDIKRKAIICGLAGLVSNVEHQGLIRDIFASFGFQGSKMYLSSDVDLAKQLIEDHGAILISGTGSICLSKTFGKEKRVGGFGYILGDEGSGFFIGKLALQAALKSKFEQDDSFILSKKLCELFKVSSINEAIKLVYNGTIKPADIAKAAPLVFEAAFKHNDERCKAIIEQCATELANHIQRAVQGSEQANFPIYLIGGVFKNENVDRFIEMIRQKVSYSHGLKFVNIAEENIAVLVILRQVKLLKEQPNRNKQDENIATFKSWYLPAFNVRSYLPEFNRRNALAATVAITGMALAVTACLTQDKVSIPKFWPGS